MTQKLQSVSPVSGDVIWTGRASTEAEIKTVMLQATSAHPDWSSTDLVDRIEIVRRYGQYLREHHGAFSNSLTREVGKLKWDADAEVNAAIAKVELSIQALQERRSELLLGESEQTDPIDGSAFSVIRRIRHQPLGVVLVLGPFNFPLHLPGGQIIPSLLAGNTVVFKPSDQAIRVGEEMMQAWTWAGLPEGVLQMIPGGVETAMSAIDSPCLSGVFLTGSREAGRAIHRQLAGRFQVVLALELGGNNPIVVANDASEDDVASIVSFSAFVSSGQRCTCARRAVFVDGSTTDGQLDALLRRTEAFTVGMPDGKATPHLGPLISSTAAGRLRKTYDDLINIGCQPLIPFRVDPSFDNLVYPSILDASSLTQSAAEALGDFEWFGPMLVIQRVKDHAEARRVAAETPYGLAAALLGGSRELFESFVQEVHAGIVNWNTSTTGAAGTMPFGGLGDSGNHRPAGFYTIDFCSDPVASIERGRLTQNDPWEVTQQRGGSNG